MTRGNSDSKVVGGGCPRDRFVPSAVGAFLGIGEMSKMEWTNEKTPLNTPATSRQIEYGIALVEANPQWAEHKMARTRFWRRLAKGGAEPAEWIPKLTFHECDRLIRYMKSRS